MTDVASLALRVDALEVSAASKELTKFAQTAGVAEQSSNKLGSVTAFLAENFRSLATGLATFKLQSFILESTTLNQRYQELGIAMLAVGRNAGISAEELDKQSAAVQKSGISMIESRGVITRLITANIDLSNATKLARLAQDAAVVGRLNSSDALDTLVHGITTAQTDVLRTIGINVSFEKSYSDLSRQLGVNQNALTKQQETQARLNAVLAESSKLTGTYEASLANAGKMLRSTERLSEDLKVKIGVIFDDTAMLAVSSYSKELKSLNEVADDLANKGTLKNWSRQVAVEFAFLADMGKNLFGIFGALGTLIVSQGENIANLDFGKMTGTFAEADRQLKAVLGDTEHYKDLVNDRIIQEDLLTAKVIGASNNLKENTKKTDENSDATNKNKEAKKKALTDAERYIESLVKETRNLGLSGIALKEKEAAYLGVSAAAKPYIEILKQAEAAEIATIDLQDSKNKQMQEGISITESLRTAEERYGDTQQKLIDAMKNGNITPETFFRGIERAGEELENATKKQNSNMQQLEFAIQGWGRSATDALVNFAVSGTASFSDFATSVLKDILRMYVQMQLITPLLQSLPGLSFGTSGGAGASTSAASSVFSNLFKGGRATGGSVAARSMYQVNENGVPELLQMDGKQFLMTANKPGTVVPMSSGGGGAGGVVVNLIESPGRGGETKQRKSSNGGIELDIMVDQLVAKKQAQQGSASNKSLRNNFGLSNNLVMR